jgi:hypothetical protein
MDHGRTHGWFVRAYRNYWYSAVRDKKFGGKGKVAEAKTFLAILTGCGDDGGACNYAFITCYGRAMRP